MFKKILFLVLAVCILSRVALASFSISTDYPTEILAEKGWIKYFNVVVTNNGDYIRNVAISFNGEYPQWFGVETNETDLQTGDNVSFLVKLSVPSSAESKTYSFTLNIRSEEVSDSKTFTVRVFNSESDALLYQVQQMESEIEDVKRNATLVEDSGKNVTEIIITLTQAQSYLNDSKVYIDSGQYDKVTYLMISAGDLIKKATYDLTVAPLNSSVLSSTTFPFELLIILALIVLLVIVFYLGFIKKKKQPIAQPTTKIKEIILEGKDSSKMENDLMETENSLNLLEEEFKENLLSKESYDELKAKYEKRISDLREEMERNRKVD